MSGNEIEIIVRSDVGRGKSTIAAEIAKMLREKFPGAVAITDEDILAAPEHFSDEKQNVRLNALRDDGAKIVVKTMHYSRDEIRAMR